MTSMPVTFPFVWRCLRGLGRAAGVPGRRCPGRLPGRPPAARWIPGRVERPDLALRDRPPRRLEPPAARAAQAGAARASGLRACPSRSWTPRASGGRRGGGVRGDFLAGLDDKRRDLFILAVLEEMTIPEVAAALSIPSTPRTRACARCAPTSNARWSAIDHDRRRTRGIEVLGAGTPGLVTRPADARARAAGDRRRAGCRPRPAGAAPGGPRLGLGASGPRGCSWRVTIAAAERRRSATGPVTARVFARQAAHSVASLSPTGVPAADPNGPSLRAVTASDAPTSAARRCHSVARPPPRRPCRAPRGGRARPRPRPSRWPSKCAPYATRSARSATAIPGWRWRFLQELDRQVPHGQLVRGARRGRRRWPAAPGATAPSASTWRREFTERHPGASTARASSRPAQQRIRPRSGDSPPRRSETMKNERTECWWLCCAAPELRLAARAGSVNIGNTTAVGSELSDYAATWDGYAEATTFCRRFRSRPPDDRRQRPGIPSSSETRALSGAHRPQRRLSAGAGHEPKDPAP